MKYPLADRIVMELERHLTRREKKQKTSVSLSGEVLRAIDTIAGASERSAVIERALRNYLKRTIRRHRHEKDLAIINAHAAAINQESEVLLGLQVWP